MDISVVIVNYNVKFFLEQCLHSVKKASQGLEVETFVVDNNSVDGSVSMVKEKFPQVKLLLNDTNRGFAVANNQAIKMAAGRYILILNPDTLLEEDSLIKCLRFMDKNHDTGALGVKMIDGKGNFLPESKRSLPNPSVAFFKIFGFSRLFPRSRIFSRYHLGYLDPNQIHEVEVLTGAFMFLRSKALEITGAFDEAFFMYGEDIDLSCRMTRAGFKNIYYPETTIIHYKGESTKKGSLNYVLTFYNAMIIFARKHFSPRMASSYTLLINLAIYFRAFLAISRRFARNISLPLLEALIFYLGFLIIKPIWESHKFQGISQYPGEYMSIVVPLYVLIWLLSLFFSGAYDKPVKIGNVIKGISVGTIIILVIYALLPESLRYSRALLLMGSGWSLLSGLMIRTIFHLLRFNGYEWNIGKKRKIVIVGKQQEADRVAGLLKRTDVKIDIAGYVNPGSEHNEPFIGHSGQLEEIIRINSIDEIIFCSRDVSSHEIIRHMMNLTNGRTEYKIAPPESLSIIGSNSINTAGNLYLIDFESITKTSNRRNKRIFDIYSSICLILFYPFVAFLVRNPLKGLANTFRVLWGKCSWVGYQTKSENDLLKFPKIRPGILFPSDALKSDLLSEDASDRINMLYVRNYKVSTDAGILLRNITQIGR